MFGKSIATVQFGGSIEDTIWLDSMKTKSDRLGLGNAMHLLSVEA